MNRQSPQTKQENQLNEIKQVTGPWLPLSLCMVVMTGAWTLVHRRLEGHCPGPITQPLKDCRWSVSLCDYCDHYCWVCPEPLPSLIGAMGLPLRHRAISNFSIFNDQNQAYELHEIQSIEDLSVNSQAIHQHSLIRSNARTASKENGASWSKVRKQWYELRSQMSCNDDHVNSKQCVDRVNLQNQSQRQTNGNARCKAGQSYYDCRRSDSLEKMLDEWHDTIVGGYDCSLELMRNHSCKSAHAQHAIHDQSWQIQQSLFSNKSLNVFKLENKHSNYNIGRESCKNFNDNSRKESIDSESGQQTLEKESINDPSKHPGGWSGYSRAKTRLLFRYDAFTFFIERQKNKHSLSRFRGKDWSFT